jgi:hypothetical protein
MTSDCKDNNTHIQIQQYVDNQSWLFRTYREKDIKRHKAREKTPFDDRLHMSTVLYFKSSYERFFHVLAIIGYHIGEDRPSMC